MPIWGISWNLRIPIWCRFQSDCLEWSLYSNNLWWYSIWKKTSWKPVDMVSISSLCISYMKRSGFTVALSQTWKFSRPVLGSFNSWVYTFPCVGLFQWWMPFFTTVTHHWGTWDDQIYITSLVILCLMRSKMIDEGIMESDFSAL